MEWLFVTVWVSVLLTAGKASLHTGHTGTAPAPSPPPPVLQRLELLFALSSPDELIGPLSFNQTAVVGVNKNSIVPQPAILSRNLISNPSNVTIDESNRCLYFINECPEPGGADRTCILQMGYKSDTINTVYLTDGVLSGLSFDSTDGQLYFIGSCGATMRCLFMLAVGQRAPENLGKLAPGAESLLIVYAGGNNQTASTQYFLFIKPGAVMEATRSSATNISTPKKVVTLDGSNNAIAYDEVSQTLIYADWKVVDHLDTLATITQIPFPEQSSKSRTLVQQHESLFLSVVSCQGKVLYAIVSDMNLQNRRLAAIDLSSLKVTTDLLGRNDVRRIHYTTGALLGRDAGVICVAEAKVPGVEGAASSAVSLIYANASAVLPNALAYHTLYHNSDRSSIRGQFTTNPSQHKRVFFVSNVGMNCLAPNCRAQAELYTQSLTSDNTLMHCLLVSTGSHIRSLTLDIDNQYLYWVEHSLADEASRLKRLSLSNTTRGPELLLDGFGKHVRGAMRDISPDGLTIVYAKGQFLFVSELLDTSAPSVAAAEQSLQYADFTDDVLSIAADFQRGYLFASFQQSGDIVQCNFSDPKSVSQPTRMHCSVISVSTSAVPSSLAVNSQTQSLWYVGLSATLEAPKLLRKNYSLSKAPAESWGLADAVLSSRIQLRSVSNAQCHDCLLINSQSYATVMLLNASAPDAPVLSALPVNPFFGSTKAIWYNANSVEITWLSEFGTLTSTPYSFAETGPVPPSGTAPTTVSFDRFYTPNFNFSDVLEAASHVDGWSKAPARVYWLQKTALPPGAGKGARAEFIAYTPSTVSVHQLWQRDEPATANSSTLMFVEEALDLAVFALHNCTDTSNECLQLVHVSNGSVKSVYPTDVPSKVGITSVMLDSSGSFAYYTAAYNLFNMSFHSLVSSVIVSFPEVSDSDLQSIKYATSKEALLVAQNLPMTFCYGATVSGQPGPEGQGLTSVLHLVNLTSLQYNTICAVPSISRGGAGSVDSDNSATIIPLLFTDYSVSQSGHMYQFVLATHSSPAVNHDAAQSIYTCVLDASQPHAPGGVLLMKAVAYISNVDFQFFTLDPATSMLYLSTNSTDRGVYSLKLPDVTSMVTRQWSALPSGHSTGSSVFPQNRPDNYSVVCPCARGDRLYFGGQEIWVYEIGSAGSLFPVIQFLAGLYHPKSAIKMQTDRSTGEKVLRWTSHGRVITYHPSSVSTTKARHSAGPVTSASQWIGTFSVIGLFGISVLDDAWGDFAEAPSGVGAASSLSQFYFILQQSTIITASVSKPQAIVLAAEDAAHFIAIGADDRPPPADGGYLYLTRQLKQPGQYTIERLRPSDARTPGLRKFESYVTNLPLGSDESQGQLLAMDFTIGQGTAPIQGCTTPCACNYSPRAQKNDGSCNLNCCPSGCTQQCACNWNPLAWKDDGSCNLRCCSGTWGCMNPCACNFDAHAIHDNGVCDVACCHDSSGLWDRYDIEIIVGGSVLLITLTSCVVWRRRKAREPVDRIPGLHTGIL